MPLARRAWALLLPLPALCVQTAPDPGVELGTTECVDPQEAAALRKRIIELERRDSDLSANLAEMARQVGTLHARNVALRSQNRGLEDTVERLEQEQEEIGGFLLAKERQVVSMLTMSVALGVALLAVAAAAAAACVRGHRATAWRGGSARDVELGAAGVGRFCDEVRRQQAEEVPVSPVAVEARLSAEPEAVSSPLLGEGAPGDGACEGDDGSIPEGIPLRLDVPLNHSVVITEKTQQLASENLGFEAELE